MRSFGSDNNSGIHPAVLEAITAANVDHAVAYGDDPQTARALKLFENQFGSGIETHFVFSGTGANIVGLATALKSFQAVICVKTAHINVDECGAPEHFTGGKLITIDSPDGKLRPDDIEQQMHVVGTEHHAQPKVISISQTNELGQVYSVAELKALSVCARKHGMYLHVDGARLANAAAALNSTLRALTRDVGVDILSFGGTKNGMLAGEAVVIFNKELFGAAQYFRKQASQLPSKLRFIAAQFEALLSNELWRKNAAHANQMAGLLAESVQGISGVKMTRPAQANAVFATLDRRCIEALQEKYFFYVWDEATNEVRWMTSFDTTEEDVQGFAAALKKIVSGV